jgi:hypothetical protein
MYIYICIYIYMYMYIGKHTCVCKYIWTHTYIYICLVEFIPFLAHVSPCVIVLAYPADTEVSIDEVFDFRGWSKENVVDYYPYMCQYIISYIYK